MADIATFGDVNGWLDALADYRGGNPEPLAAMLRRDTLPDWARLELADTVAAAPLKRKPGKNRAKVTADQRRRIADMMRDFNWCHGLPLDEQRFIQLRAEWRQALLEELAAEANLKPDTVRKLSKRRDTSGT